MSGTLVLASNRLAFTRRRAESGSWKSIASAGGMVSTLGPTARLLGAKWVGWSGCSDPSALEGLDNNHDGYLVYPITLSERDIDEYYNGLNNGAIWPLFHGLLNHYRTRNSQWSAQRRVNELFTKEIRRVSDSEDFIWVHDPNLSLVAEMFGPAGRGRMGYYNHIPFPSRDILLRFPWARELVDALLHFSLLGFQTSLDQGNFLEFVRAEWPDARMSPSAMSSEVSIEIGPRTSKTGVFPVCLDYQRFVAGIDEVEVEARAQRIREDFRTPYLLLAVERLDYTKGIVEHLLGIESVLENRPDLRGKLQLIQILVPSRLKVPAYRNLKDEIDRTIGRINSRFAQDGWVPIYCRFASLDSVELAAHYRAADAALITPLRDGQNLVAKEYCAVCRDDAALILSVSCGAAVQLGESALLVHPHHVDEIGKQILCAIEIPPVERCRRMEHLKKLVQSEDVKFWAAAFLESAGATELAMRLRSYR